MKQVVASACLLLTLACALLAQKPSAPNRPPRINSFTHSPERAVIACRYGLSIAAPECNWPGQLKLTLETVASDPDGDKLAYKYKVGAGRVVGEGPAVVWDLAGVAPGAYAAEVFVEDGRGGEVSASTSIELVECTTCPVPCAMISISCPEAVDEGETLVASLNVSGGEPSFSPTYNWSVSDGRIVKGQGTYRIEVDTSGLAGRSLKVSVEVGGYPPECDKIESCEVPIRNKSEGRTARHAGRIQAPPAQTRGASRVLIFTGEMKRFGY